VKIEQFIFRRKEERMSLEEVTRQAMYVCMYKVKLKRFYVTVFAVEMQ
jgi:hypothetical protein